MARRIGIHRDIGYLRLRFGAAPAPSRQLDAAFDALGGARAIILDLRDSAGPATRAEMDATLARFATAPGVWRVRLARGGLRAEDRVTPLAGHARVPLVVLVDRWTRGEAESLAVGLRAVAGATLVGTPTAGLRGVQGTAQLPHSGITLRYPVERALAPDGSPREDAVPDLAVDLTAPSAGPGDPILYQALKRLERP
jgi:carboxyl-terminal processing protease